jgi:hypothetical protein
MISAFNISKICLVAGFFVLPFCYITLCTLMSGSRVPRAPYIPFFCIFGSYGGWLVAFGLSPSGLTAVSLIFLLTIAPFSLIVCAVWSWRLRSVSRYHRAALYGSFSYFGFLLALVCISWIFQAD